MKLLMFNNISKTYKKFKEYLDNTLWIMGDKFIGLGVSFIVAVIVARYLGPKDFGVYSYVWSLVTLFSVAGHMGLAGLVVREIVGKPEERAVVLGTTFTLKLIGMSVGYLCLLIYSYIYEGMSSVEFLLIAIAGTTLILRCFDVFDYWFQSFVQAKYVSIANIIGLLVSSSLKVIFVLLGVSLSFFIYPGVLHVVVIGLILMLFYYYKSSLSLKDWTFSWGKAKELLGQGWLIYLGSIFAIINLKVDQIMLKWYLGSEEVGIYAVAAQLSEAWYFIPTAIVASFFPKLIELRKSNYLEYEMRLQQLFNVLFLMSIVVAIVVTISGEFIINLFFGVEYRASANILVVHIWAAVFIFMRALFSRWILLEDALIFSLLTQAVGAVANIVLNYYWINLYGTVGAAYATFFSYAGSSFLALFLYSKTRPIFWMMCKAMVLHSMVFKR